MHSLSSLIKKNKNPLDSALLAIKKQKTTSLHKTNCISTKSSVRTEFNFKLVQWNEKNIFRLYSGICKDKYPMWITAAKKFIS